ncbi:MAG: pilus assembly protein PilM [Clostridiales bacterium]|nr:pilus assembly protein PilM [Clostridiales bacterium]
MKKGKVIKKPIVSLDIGHKYIKAVVGKYADGHLKIMNAFIFETPMLSIENGRINDMNALISAISKELGNKNIKKGFMNVTYNANDLIERELILPGANPDELKEMVKYEVQQYLPIDIEKYVLQYKIAQEIVEDSHNVLKILVSVIEKEIVESYMDLIRKLGFKPYRFDVHSNSVDKIISLLMKNPECSFKDKTIAIIDIGHKTTNISLFEKGVFQMSQEMEYGGQNMDVLLEERMGFSRKDAIELKEKIYNLTIYGDENNLTNLPKRAIIDSLSEGTREIHSVFRYYASNKEDSMVEEVIICGGVSYLNGVESYLSSVFNLPVKRIGEYSDIGKLMPGVDVENCINAIGAIISRE